MAKSYEEIAREVVEAIVRKRKHKFICSLCNKT